MGTLTKTFVVLNLVFSIAFVMVSATVLSQRQHWKVKHNDLQSKYAGEKSAWAGEKRELEQANNALKDDRDKHKKDAGDLRKELDTSKATVAEQQDAITEWKKKEEDANRRVELLSQNVNRLASDLAATQKARDDARGDLTKTRAQLSTRNMTLMGLRAELADQNLRHKEVLHRYRIATEQIKYDKEVLARVESAAPDVFRTAVKGTEGGVAVPPVDQIRAVVQAVNPNAKLVVLNVGSKSTPAVKKGYRFLVYRGRVFVAAVSVTSVEGELCAAKVIDPPTSEIIQVGDSAVTQTY
ncbi:MAG: hypothetical protein ABIF82_05005 [Planctomycetota bacterium]